MRTMIVLHAGSGLALVSEKTRAVNPAVVMAAVVNETRKRGPAVGDGTLQYSTEVTGIDFSWRLVSLYSSETIPALGFDAIVLALSIESLHLQAIAAGTELERQPWGRLKTDASMAVPGVAGVFAVGEIANRFLWMRPLPQPAPDDSAKQRGGLPTKTPYVRCAAKRPCYKV